MRQEGLQVTHRLHLPSTVLDPLQVDIAEAGARHPLQAVHVVLVDLHAEDLGVSLNVVPLGVGLQRLLDGGVLEPRRQLGRVDQVVDDALGEGGRGTIGGKANGEEMCACAASCVAAADHNRTPCCQAAIFNYD